jgi:hypothetical protein
MSGRYCLNDLHKAAGGEGRHKPSMWAANADTQKFVQELSKAGFPALVSVKGGAAPGTYASKLAVFKYAGWISAEFEVHVYNTFDKVVTGQYRPVSPEETNEQLALAVLEEVRLRKEGRDYLIDLTNQLNQNGRGVDTQGRTATTVASHPETGLISREWEGQVFLFREDGYFNMNKTSEAFGKHLPNFWKSPETERYMEILSRTIDSTDLVHIVPGNRYVPGRGTWAHPKLAVFFARWLSMEFGFFCDMVIDDILTKKAELVITKPETSASVQVAQQF